MERAGKQRKAIVAGLIAGLGAAGVAAFDGSVTLAEWCTIAGVTLVGWQGTYWTRNDSDPATGK